MTEVKLKDKKGYKIPVEKALKILKRKLEKEGTFDELKERRNFVPESEKKRLAKKRAEAAQRRRQQQNNNG